VNTIKEMAERLRTQDQRCTRDPMFCVQVCDRIGPIMEGYSTGDGLMIRDQQEYETYYDDGPEKTKFRQLIALHNGGRLSDRYIVAGYANVWKTVAVCFTDVGCQQHLDANGHNYRDYHGTRIYVESWHGNPEMMAVMEMIKTIGGETKGAV
jgi:hypothetical protein